MGSGGVRWVDRGEVRSGETGRGEMGWWGEEVGKVTGQDEGRERRVLVRGQALSPHAIPEHCSCIRDYLGKRGS